MEKRVYKEFTKIYLRVKIKELLNNCFLIVGMSWVLEDGTPLMHSAPRIVHAPLAPLYLNRDPFN
jgi:hypothetical protein